MAKTISKCGLDCGTCPWGPYPRKRMTPQEFELYRNRAKEILGYMPIKSPCVTCQTPDDKIPKGSKLPNRKCLIRQCIDKTGITNCAFCLRFPCDTLKATSGVWNRKTIEKKLGGAISEQNYHVFVEPFEGISRLEMLRTTLETEEIVELAKIVANEPKSIDFPRNLPFSEEETTALRAAHTLLTSLQRSSLGLRDPETYTQHHKIEDLKAHVFRFLWIIGCWGKFEKEKQTHLVIDAKTYLENRGTEKKLAIWSYLKYNVFPALSEFGIACARIVQEGVKEEDLTTGTDYLRSKGWIFKISFDQKAGGSATLKALQTYARRIDTVYGKKAFQHFRDVDMQILAKR